MIRKKNYLRLSLVMFLLSTSSIKADEPESNAVWEQLKVQSFPKKHVREKAEDLLFIEVPDKVEDAAFLPITIKSMGAQTPQHHIKTLHLIIDNNPDPIAAVFHLSPHLGALSLSLRIRMESFSYIRAIVEMNDGSYHMISKFVIASGGCSAPVSKSPGDSGADDAIGQIKIRNRQATNGRFDVQAIIRHPNHNGFQMDPATRHYIKPHYINHIHIFANDKLLIKADTSISISENPSLRFSFTASNQSTTLKVVASDTEGGQFQQSKQLVITGQ